MKDGRQKTLECAGEPFGRWWLKRHCLEHQQLWYSQCTVLFAHNPQRTEIIIVSRISSSLHLALTSALQDASMPQHQVNGP